MNIDCHPHYFLECQVSYWWWRVVPVSLIVIGTVGNVLSLLVLLRKNLRRLSASVYLLFLAASDLLFIWSYTVRETLYAITGINLINLSSVFCRGLFWMGLTSASFSIWLLVSLTIERVFMTRFPVYSYQRLTPKLATKICCALLVVVMVANGHVIFGFTLHDVDTFSEGSNFSEVHRRIIERFPCQFISEEYFLFYVTYWNMIYMIFFNIIPIIIITTGNISIAATILTQRKKMKVHPVSSCGNTTAVSCKSSVSEQRQISSVRHVNDAERLPKFDDVNTSEPRDSTQNNSSVTRLLFVICAFFVITTVPFAVFYVFKPHVQEVSYKGVARIQLIQSVIHSLMFSNFSLNFFLYFVSGTLFKQEWTRLKAEVRNKMHCVSI